MRSEEETLGYSIAGKYLVKRLINRGGSGLVWEGEHTELGKRVAIKTVTCSANQADAASRFRLEARAASAAESDHIIQVFDVGSDPEVGLFIVMEYLSGKDLGEYIRENLRLSPIEAVRLAYQIARGLAKAHEAGVVHRDLKPGNVILLPREEGVPLVKILDFGISKVADKRTPLKGNITRDGVVVGTPQYMSPEQAQGLMQVDQRTDVWSLGVVLFEMLSGRPPFDEPTYERMIVRIVTEPIPKLSEEAPDVPEPLAKLVEQALERDLDARIPDCATFASRLREALPEAFAGVLIPGSSALGSGSGPRINTLTSSVSNTAVTVEEVIRRPRRSRPAVVYGLLGLVVVIGIVAFVSLRPISTPPTLPVAAKGSEVVSSSQPSPIVASASASTQADISAVASSTPPPSSSSAPAADAKKLETKMPGGDTKRPNSPDSDKKKKRQIDSDIKW